MNTPTKADYEVLVANSERKAAYILDSIDACEKWVTGVKTEIAVGFFPEEMNVIMRQVVSLVELSIVNEKAIANEYMKLANYWRTKP